MLKREMKPFVVCCIFLFFTLFAFGFYFTRTLKGDLNNHILSGEMFGVPEDLARRGVKPRYYGSGQTGWDGQFYYYMANDICGTKDTREHIDSPSYRYQRIGLSLFVAIAAFFTGREWVSPTFFFWAYFSLLALAVWLGAKLFFKFSITPYAILFWGTWVGTQITLFNALPDAAADAFLLFALFLLAKNRFFLASLFFCFSTLSREVYVLFPSCIFAYFFLEDLLALKRNGFSFKKLFLLLCQYKRYYLISLPCFVLLAWRLYVINLFGITPEAEAHGILALPLSSWLDYFYSSLINKHHLLGPGEGSFSEGVLLFLFLCLLFFSLYTAIVALRKNCSAYLSGVSTATILLSFLYLSFGPTVMMHYTGYLKVCGVFLIILPILLAAAHPPVMRRSSFVLLIILWTFSSYFNFKFIILPDHDRFDPYTRLSQIARRSEVPSLPYHSAVIDIDDVYFPPTFGTIDSLFNKPLLLVKSRIGNKTTEPFVSASNRGGVFMSYHWLDSYGNVVQDGIRSALPEAISPGQQASADIVTPLPEKEGRFYLKLSPVQEGYAWFYLTDSEGGYPQLQFDLCRGSFPFFEIRHQSLLSSHLGEQFLFYKMPGHPMLQENVFHEGLSPEEDGFAWSSGKRTVFHFLLPEHFEGALSATFDVAPFLSENIDRQNVIVYVNDNLLEMMKIDRRKTVSLSIPERYIEGRALKLTFEYLDAVSPHGIASSGDTRTRTLAWHSIELDKLFFPLNRVVTFDYDGDGASFLGSGWYPSEAWGCWGGEHSNLLIPLPKDKTLELVIHGHVYPYAESVMLSLNGLELATLIPGKTETVVPLPHFSDDVERLGILEFHALRSVSPQIVGESEDNRVLGFGIIKLQLREKQ